METKILWLVDPSTIKFIFWKNITYSKKDKYTITIFDAKVPILELKTFYEIDYTRIFENSSTSNTVITIYFINLPKYLDPMTTQSFWLCNYKTNWNGYTCTISPYDNEKYEHMDEVISLNNEKMIVISRIINYDKGFIRLIVRIIEKCTHQLVNKNVLEIERRWRDFANISWKYD